MVITKPKQPYVVWSLPFEYWTIWIPDKHSVRYSDESGIRVSGIQMVTVLKIVEWNNEPELFLKLGEFLTLCLQLLVHCQHLLFQVVSFNL